MLLCIHGKGFFLTLLFSVYNSADNCEQTDEHFDIQALWEFGWSGKLQEDVTCTFNMLKQEPCALQVTTRTCSLL